MLASCTHALNDGLEGPGIKWEMGATMWELGRVLRLCLYSYLFALVLDGVCRVASRIGAEVSFFGHRGSRRSDQVQVVRTVAKATERNNLTTVM